LEFLLIFLQRLKIATSNSVRRFGFPRPIIKLHSEEKWAWLWARGASQNLAFPFNVSATTEGIDHKVGREVGIAKAHHKIPPRGKRGRGHGLRELPKMCFFLNIYAMAESISTSNLVHSLGGQLGPS